MTLPILSAGVRALEPDRRSRRPRSEQHEAMLGASVSGGGLTIAIGRPTTTPTTMTQPRTTRDPSIRLERDEHRVATAHSTAAPRPPMMAVTRGSVAGRSSGRAWRRVSRGARRCGTIRLRARRSSRAARPIDHLIRHNEVRHLGQDAPHLDRRAYAVGTQARPQAAEPPRGPPAPPQRREDLRREGPDRGRAARRHRRSIPRPPSPRRSARSTARPRPARSTRTPPPAASRA